MARILIELEINNIDSDEVTEAHVINYLQELIDNNFVGYEIIED